MLDASELASVLAEEGTRRYVAMTRDTTDADAEAAYLHWVEEVEPQTEPRWNALERSYLDHPQRPGLSSFYEIHDRSVANSVALFRAENVPLGVEESRLEQRYLELCGSQTVLFEGRERTMDEMGLYLEEPDREVREHAWRQAGRRRLQDADDLEEIFDHLLDTRHRMARNAGFASYRDYAFRALERFDYGPEDCLRFHEGIERAVVPLARELDDARRRRLGLPALRPWDLQVDPRGLPPLRPRDLLENTREIAARLHPDFADQIDLMARHGLMDLDSRPGKAPGDYQSVLEEARLPFLFMNTVGRDSDVRGLLHECGHAFHTFASRHFDLADYRHAPMEFSEVASMAMELLGGEHLDVFYDPADLRRSRLDHLQDVVSTLPHIAMVDAFQHWLYTHPGHTRAERRQEWIRQMERFAPAVDWTDLEEERETRWHLVVHLYESPFYFVEYGFAQLGALEVWRNQDLAAFRRALALGGSARLPDLYEAAGARFDFGPERVRKLLDPVLAEIRDE